MDVVEQHRDATAARGSLIGRYALWWTLAIGPAGVLLVYLAFRFDWEWILNKEVNEVTAVVLLPIAVVVAAVHAIVARNSLQWWLACFALIAFLRELHFQGTDSGVWFALALLIAAAWWWWPRLVGPLHEGIMLPMIVGTFGVYALSLAISRRAFRDIPGLTFESELHIPLEEVLENVAHIMLVLTVFCGSWRPIVDRESLNEREGDC